MDTSTKSTENNMSKHPQSAKLRMPNSVKSRVNMECSIHLNDLCSTHDVSLEPKYVWARSKQQVLESVELRFLGEDLKSVGPFASKKHAKEAICTIALPRMRAFLDRKRKANQISTSSGSEINDTGKSFVRILQEYCHSQRTPLPRYSVTSTVPPPFHFRCDVHIQDTSAITFGSMNGLYPSKRVAREAAAREAVEWLRKQGRMATLSAQNPLLVPLSHGRTKTVEHDYERTNAREWDSDNDDDIPPQKTIAKHSRWDDFSPVLVDLGVPDNYHVLPTTLRQEVHLLIVSLGFFQPEFVARPTDPSEVSTKPSLNDTFVDMVVNFDLRNVSKEPRLAGVQVTHVYGKRAARELCCKELLRVLGTIKASRDHLI